MAFIPNELPSIVIPPSVHIYTLTYTYIYIHTYIYITYVYIIYIRILTGAALTANDIYYQTRDFEWLAKNALIDLGMYVCMCLYVCVFVCMCVCMYIIRYDR